DAILRDQIKKGLATQKLVEKITGKIEAPKDSEIQAFYDGNKEAFVKRKGVKLAAIIVDPGNSGEGDTTIDEVSAVAKANEIVGKLKAGQQFADLAREFSEDQSKFQGGDLGYISEDDLKQEFSDATAAYLMNPQFQVGGIVTARAQGKLFILKLQDRSDKDEALTLESPGVREQVQKSLVDTRKQLLTAAYQTIALNEAKIENYLAKKVVENPNELSGARPASPANTAPAANSTPAGNTNSNTAGESPKANANAPAKDTKPAEKAPAAPAAKK
ncbi:MAG: peptidyl-prolyl cis-trans isomerase, partial [Pyrinomonadaceae bacterium]|nr:peptidyl-prolyl cis-trans isomerase [Pyrinomonadaceae bacterium]